MSDSLIKDCLFSLAKRIGPRPLGSLANQEARLYLSRSLGSLGLPVSTQPTRKQYSMVGESQVRCLGKDGWSLDSWPAFGSCTAMDVVAPIVDCGHGTAAEIPSTAQGGIGVVRRGVIHEELKLKNLKKAGAVGSLLYVEYENALYSGRVSADQSVIPAAVVRHNDAKLLLRTAKLGPVLVSLSVTAELRTVDCVNVISDANPIARRHLVLCAHYDSRACTPGANDNAAGVACVLALAHALAVAKTRPDVRVVFFDGEELGLVGSRAYAESTWMDGCDTVINLDALGAGRLSILTKDRMGDLDEGLAVEALTCAQSRGIGIKLAQSRTGLSDHAPLREKGARVLWLSDHPNNGRETDVDVPEAVDVQELTNACELVLGLLHVR